jgi:hypothetical protein
MHLAAQQNSSGSLFLHAACISTLLLLLPLLATCPPQYYVCQYSPPGNFFTGNNDYAVNVRPPGTTVA